MTTLPELPTKITAVTIYRDGARVERTGTLTLQPGPHKLCIPNLTQYLDKDSVRVSGRGFASIVGFDTVDTTVETSGYTQLDTLVKRKEALEKQKTQIERELTYLSARETFFAQVLEKSAVEFSKWIPAGECEVERLTNLEKLTTAQIEKLEKSRIKIFEQKEQVEKDLAIINREISKFHREVKQYEVTNTILLNVEAQKAGECEFRITYFVGHTAWAPTYDFVLTEESALVTMYTVVNNNTREDWKQVRLTVSTATSQPATIVEPSPYLIREYIPRPMAAPTPSRMALKARTAKRAADEMGTMELAEKEEPVAPPPPEMTQVTATVVETGGVHVFVLPDLVTVPADGEPHAFRTSHTELLADRKFFWNAVSFAEAIELTTIKNSETVLLPGKARIYSDDDYLGETMLKVIAPQEEVDVGTRFSYAVKVEKRLIAKSTEKTGLTRGNVGREYQYELTIKNFRKKPSPIKIMDRIPHSDSEKIKVQTKKFSHEPTESKLSVFKWELDIPAEGEVKITYSFEVEYPRGLTITPPLP